MWMNHEETAKTWCATSRLSRPTHRGFARSLALGRACCAAKWRGVSPPRAPSSARAGCAFPSPAGRESGASARTFSGSLRVARSFAASRRHRRRRQEARQEAAQAQRAAARAARRRRRSRRPRASRCRTADRDLQSLRRRLRLRHRRRLWRRLRPSPRQCALCASRATTSRATTSSCATGPAARARCTCSALRSPSTRCRQTTGSALPVRRRRRPSSR